MVNIEYRNSAADLTVENLTRLWHSVGWDVMDSEMLLKMVQNAGYLVVAWEANELVGVLLAWDNYTYIHLDSICVRPYYQRLGIGSKMLGMLLEEYPNQPVHADVKKDGVNLLTKFGFTPKVGVPMVRRVSCSDED